MTRKAMEIGTNTYGYYSPETQVFECTHGAWSSKVEILDDTHCIVFEVDKQKPRPYKWLEAVPDEFVF